jgi:hypothetical protein
MIGNTTEPGITGTVTSATTIPTVEQSPGDMLVVGGADLSGPNAANAEEVYAVADAPRARTLFGEDSALTRGVIDALYNGAMPVYAIAPTTTTTTDDLSGLGSTSHTLSEPMLEDVSQVTVTVDSDPYTVEFKYEDVSSLTPGTDTAFIEPGSGDLELDTAPSSSGDVEFEALDYSAALEAARLTHGDTIDFINPVTEHDTVVSDVQGTLATMESNRQTALGIAAVPPGTDPSSFTNSYDDSRLQLISNARTKDGYNFSAAFAGKRAELGLTATPINQRLVLQDEPIADFDTTARGNFINENVTPMETIGKSVRIADDLTTVSDSNTEEANLKYGFSRLAADFVINTVHEYEQPFIGKFNSDSAVNALRGILRNKTRPLKSSRVVYDYDVDVQFISPTEAKVVFQSDVAEPIRFIHNEFVIGNDLPGSN